jgi:hypothetical protein
VTFGDSLSNLACLRLPCRSWCSWSMTVMVCSTAGRLMMMPFNCSCRNKKLLVAAPHAGRRAGQALKCLSMFTGRYRVL